MFSVLNALLTTVLLQTLTNQFSCNFINLNEPIVIHEGSTDDNYFGYSIHASSSRTQGAISATSRSGKIYVGAPKANNSVGRESGVVWQCNFEFGETDKIVCDNALQDFNPRRRDCCKTNPCFRETVDKMWLGSSLTSTGDGSQFVSCGYRLQHDSNAYYRDAFGIEPLVDGICYLVSNAEPLAGKSDQITVKAFQPPFRSKNWFYGEFGFSLVFEKTRKLILVGAPGYNIYQGTVVIYELDLLPTSIIPCNQSPVPKMLHSLSIEHYDYLGYALTSGKFYDIYESYFAAGAPRGGSIHENRNLNGYVVIIKFNQYTRAWQTEIRHTELIYGDQFGSYFGSVLASSDLNGDGLHELIVGAPLYNTQTASDSFDEGCVFVYRRTMIESKLGLVERLCGKTYSSRFGSAVTNLGDIDFDGYDDIAISAPGYKDGVGIVYVFYGSKTKLSDRPPLEIAAVSKGVIGFGSSLSGNVDIDGNGTPDLMISSYVSKLVVVYRTRPKVDIRLYPKFLKRQQPIEKFRREDKEFTIKGCVGTYRKPIFKGKLKIWVEVTADSDMPEGKERFVFAENNQKRLEFVQNVTSYDCSKFIAVKLLEKNLEPNDVREITFLWKLVYNETVNVPTVIRNVNISNGKANEVLPAQPCSFCPAATEIEYRHSFPLANDNCDLDGNPTCSSNLVINATILGQMSSRKDYIIGSPEPIILEIVLSNKKETAYNPIVEISATFKSNSSSINVKIFLTDSNQGCGSATNSMEKPREEKSGIYECGIPLHQDTSMKLKFKITFENPMAMPFQETLQLKVTAHPKLHRAQLATINIDVKLSSDFKLRLTAIDPLMNNPKTISLANKIRQTNFLSSFTVSNHGLSPLPAVKLIFKIPVKTNDQQVIVVYEPRSKQLLCSTSDPMGFETFENTENREASQILNSSLKSPTISRRRRSQSQKLTTYSSGATTNKKTLQIGCGQLTEWKCITITCMTTTPLRLNNPINVDLRLAFVSGLPNKLIPEYIKKLSVITEGQAEIFEDGKFTINELSTVIFKVEQVQGIPVMWIVLSVIGGLVLVFLLSVFLYRCGFFRRTVQEDLKALKENAEKEDIVNKHFPNVNIPDSGN